MLSSHSRIMEGTATSRTHLPALSKPQATVLALWSLGMVLARASALTAVAAFLALWWPRPEQTVRQQLREGCYEAEAKRGDQRQAVDPQAGFVPLWQGIVGQWQGTQVALALDATTLGTRFTVLAISVVSRGGAMPVAWTILPAHQPHGWRRAWVRRLRPLHPASPTGWTVIVLADRGRYAGWLLRRIVRLGWHPCLRMNASGTFGPTGHGRCYPLTTFGPHLGSCWRGTGTAFNSAPRPRPGTWLGCWAAGDTAPGLLLTDWPPEARDAGWYGLRAWIEQGFTVTKRAGWPWPRTRMTEPPRAARRWLAGSVATLWRLRVGGMAAAAIPDRTLLDVSAALGVQRRPRRATRLRVVRALRRGWTLRLVAVLNHEPWPRGTFLPEPWPMVAAINAPCMVHDAGVLDEVAA
ncbi:MAG TPA: transposase [Candidatus Tectomicrobia bacterium]